MVLWAQIVAYSDGVHGVGRRRQEEGRRTGSGETGEIATYRVNGLLPVIVWDEAARERRVVPMRWGFPDPRDLLGRGRSMGARRPSTPGAAQESLFHAGQRGVVVFRTFNEGEEVTSPSGKTATRQWTIDPRDGRPRGFAFVWRRFELPDLPAPMLACVMVTVPANELIRRTIKSGEDDPRMPAILEDEDWPTWLGEEGATPDGREGSAQDNGRRELDGGAGAERGRDRGRSDSGSDTRRLIIRHAKSWHPSWGASAFFGLRRAVLSSCRPSCVTKYSRFMNGAK